MCRENMQWDINAYLTEKNSLRDTSQEEPVMPGVLTVEALAQAGAVAILSLEENKGKIAYFGGINKCKFKGKIVPGDKVRLETKIIRRKGPVGVGEAVASVDGKSSRKCRAYIHGRIDKSNIGECKER